MFNMSLAMLILLFVSVVFKILPPKKINYLYGYRTSSSMKDIEAWKIANKYSATLMILLFTVLTFLSFGLELLNINSEILMLILMVSAFAITIILTERKLKANK